MRNTYGVTVTVNGKPWRRVPNLTDAGARDRVFTVIRTDGGRLLCNSAMASTARDHQLRAK
jgi:hypothetical protein